MENSHLFFCLYWFYDNSKTIYELETNLVDMAPRSSTNSTMVTNTITATTVK
jgi:hypothetical protein